MTLSPTTVTIITIVLPILVISTGTVMAIRILKKTQSRSNAPLQYEAAANTYTVPLKASFTVIKGLRALSVADNSLHPRLVLHPDFIEYKVLRLRKRPYSDIEQVHIRLAPFTVNVILEFKDSRRAFAGNLNNKQKLADVLRILKKKCPLSPRAQQFLDEAEQGNLK